MLLFEELKFKGDSFNHDINEFKIVLLNDTMYLGFAPLGGIEFDKCCESTINELITLTKNIIYKTDNDSDYLTSSHINRLCEEAFNYLISINRLVDVIEFDRTDFMYASEQLPIENYLHAFQLIQLLLMGVLTDSDRNGLLVG